jgi:hypothetical protein
MSKLSFWWKTPPPTLHLVYAGKHVAELKRVKLGNQQLYQFRYLPAFKELNLAPLPGLPKVDEDNWSAELWGFFAERIPDVTRPEVDALIKAKRINRYDQLQMLAELGGHSVTDPFEITRVAS